MSFINPIDLLDLQSTDILKIDPETIKKAKKRIQAEIILSDDGQFTYNEVSLAQSDIEKAIDELTDKVRLEFYHSIANNPKLNSFLFRGDLGLFDGFRIESIYKITEFINFISPYFAARYDEALAKAFKEKKIETFKKILSVNPLIKNSDLDKIYRSVNTWIRNQINDLDALTTELRINQDWDSANNTDSLINEVEDKLPSTLINLLPNYLQGLRNQTAQSIRNLSVSLFNATGETLVALKLVQYAADITIDGITQQNLEKDIKHLHEIYQNETRNKKLETSIAKYANMLVEIRNRLEDVHTKATSSSMTLIWINSNISVSEINSFDTVFDEVRNQTALGLKALSVAIWNNSSDMETSLALIEKALSIKTTGKTRQDLIEAKDQLEQLKVQINLARQAVQQNATQRSNSSNDGCIIAFALLVLVAVIYGIINSPNKSSTKSTSKENTYKPQELLTNDPPAAEEIKNKGNRLKNGLSPYDQYFGKGVYKKNLNNFIEFKNGNSYDAVVCLVDIHTGRTIRNEYIMANSSFKMTNVPNGTYTVKSFYGNDWNPNKRLMNGLINGGFDTNFHFSKSDGLSKQIILQDDGYNYSGYTVTLYTVTNGNMSQQSINESEFF
jgi:hypothetical protein